MQLVAEVILSLAIAACVLGAVLLLRRGLFGPRDRARRRCPRCRFDMRGTAGRQCTECGSITQRDDLLHPRTRRWRSAAAGSCVAIVSVYLLLKWTRVQRGDWKQEVPDTVWVVAVGSPAFYAATAHLELDSVGAGGFGRWARLWNWQQVMLDAALRRRMARGDGEQRRKAAIYLHMMVSFVRPLSSADVAAYGRLSHDADERARALGLILLLPHIGRDEGERRAREWLDDPNAGTEEVRWVCATMLDVLVPPSGANADPRVAQFAIHAIDVRPDLDFLIVPAAAQAGSRGVRDSALVDRLLRRCEVRRQQRHALAFGAAEAASRVAAPDDEGVVGAFAMLLSDEETTMRNRLIGAMHEYPPPVHLVEAARRELRGDDAEARQAVLALCVHMPDATLSLLGQDVIDGVARCESPAPWSILLDRLESLAPPSEASP